MRLHLILPALMLIGCAYAADTHRILVQGHRGARTVRPENTIPAFEYAIQAGADVVELDTVLTRDNVVVVSHDATLHPPICTGPRDNAAIRELTFEEVRQWDCGATLNPAFPRQEPVPGTRIPTLAQVFELAPRGNFEFNVEIKTPASSPEPEEYAGLVLEQIRKYRLERRVIVQSFNFRMLHAMKKLAPEIKLSALYGGKPRDFVDVAREAGAGNVSMEQKLVTPEQVRAAHAAGLQVYAWTANTPKEWEPLVRAGVDAIITDDPAGLLAYLRERGLH